jgi:Ala-tRNA(Pro) deacylase
MAVIPATHHVELGLLGRQLNRQLGLATETELSQLFRDCNVGAIPPIGQAYGVDVIMEDSLSDCADIYFEAGDHTELIHMRGTDFLKLMSAASHGHFSHHL